MDEKQVKEEFERAFNWPTSAVSFTPMPSKELIARDIGVDPESITSIKIDGEWIAVEFQARGATSIGISEGVNGAEVEG